MFLPMRLHVTRYHTSLASTHQTPVVPLILVPSKENISKASPLEVALAVWRAGFSACTDVLRCILCCYYFRETC